MDELAKDPNFQGLNPVRDSGYFVEFEHPNEAAELMFRKINQKMLQGVIGTDFLPSIFGWQDLVPQNTSEEDFSKTFMD